MPEPAEILAGLTTIANEALLLALAWHLVLGAALLALAKGWRPSQRTARVLVALPLASVAMLALLYGNPFNGVVFAVGTLALLALARRGSHEPVRRGPPWMFWAGAASLSFGWVYPHFLDATPVAYLIAAPLGLVPCPTLAVAIGAALLGGGLGARAWSLTLATLGLFYGAFGVLRLGVFLDAGLILAAAVLFVAALRGERASSGPPRALWTPS